MIAIFLEEKKIGTKYTGYTDYDFKWHPDQSFTVTAEVTREDYLKEYEITTGRKVINPKNLMNINNVNAKFYLITVD